MSIIGTYEAEYWNIGIMNTGNLENWNAETDPTFQYSSIPLFQSELQAKSDPVEENGEGKNDHRATRRAGDSEAQGRLGQAPVTII